MSRTPSLDSKGTVHDGHEPSARSVHNNYPNAGC